MLRFVYVVGIVGSLNPFYLFKWNRVCTIFWFLNLRFSAWLGPWYTFFISFQGAANRKVAATNMNRASSRSHSVFTCLIESKVHETNILQSCYWFVISSHCGSLVSRCHSGIIYAILLLLVMTHTYCPYFLLKLIIQWESQGINHHRFSRLNLVDLAGSER